MKNLWVVVLLVIALTLSGCAPAVGIGTGAGSLMTGITANSVEVGDSASDTTEFAMNLLRDTYEGKNTVVSPASAYLALAMTANGAAGSTLSEFEQVLSAPLAGLNNTGKLLLDAFNASSDGLTLKAVNGIWYNADSVFEPNRDFLQTNADYFSVAAFASDFSKPSTVDTINEFISSNTNGLIEQMLDQLDDNTIMVLVNTLYFNGIWQNQFDPNNTHDAAFTLSDGENISTPTMIQEYKAVSYFESDDAKGVILPYKDDRYAYVAVLPDSSAAEYVAALTGERFLGLIRTASNQNVVLHLPKYEVKGKYNLNDVLNRMGLRAAFNPDNADFSAMGTASGPIYIGRVLQNTVFKLGEEGTEAAAATVVEACEGCAAPDEMQPIELHLDRPFMYALMDMETMTPLFVGVVENPAG